MESVGDANSLVSQIVGNTWEVRDLLVEKTGLSAHHFEVHYLLSCCSVHVGRKLRLEDCKLVAFVDMERLENIDSYIIMIVFYFKKHDIGLSLNLSNRYFWASYFHLLGLSVLPHNIGLDILASHQLVEDLLFDVGISSVLNFAIVGQLRVVRSVEHVILVLYLLVIHVLSKLWSMNIVVTSICLSWI